ncbi:986_t:CDS:2 [Ambispora leptoticha]|uniref:986_t:CDS:1 n=1 Tax=Ambispora leptoticha TaxID=144679 RepID=A0A9N9EN67_9GLOM|nr:986_t:CDS:2 [Ambispora leptoticha]
MSQTPENTISSLLVISFENSSPTIVTSTTKKKKRSNVGGRPKSLVWGIHAEQGIKVSDVPVETRQFFLNRLAEKSEPGTNL